MVHLQAGFVVHGAPFAIEAAEIRPARKLLQPRGQLFGSDILPQALFGASSGGL
jgi:hypothetical protein